MAILVIFDFDNTLGDTYGTYGEGNIFRTKTALSEQESTQIYEKYRRGSDDIIAYQDLLDAYGIDDPEDFFRQAGMHKQLYPDVVSSLVQLQEYPDVTTVILTTGDEDFQKLKTSITGVDVLVDKVYITRDRNKIKHIQSIHDLYAPDMTVFVDDRIHMTKQDFDFPIEIYEMNRKGEDIKKYSVEALQPILDRVASLRLE